MGGKGESCVLLEHEGPTQGATLNQSAGWSEKFDQHMSIQEVLESCEHRVVDVSSLSLDTVVRAANDPEHVALVAELADSLPPILVHGPSGRVLDGSHRVQAARLTGRATVPALVYNGHFRDGFVVAVWANSKHGLPLSRQDRISAATKIIESHRTWSNRMIAGVAGISPVTVAAIRRKMAAELTQGASRMGLDGRVRPVDRSAGRERASNLWQESPDSTVRAIARRAGVSPATALDVRKKLQSGLDPIQPRQQTRTYPSAQEKGTSISAGFATLPSPLQRTPGEPSHLNLALARLMRDPSMRQTDSGRELLRLLDFTTTILKNYEQLATNIPDHCAWSICDIARKYAEMWERFADQLEVDKPKFG